MCGSALTNTTSGQQHTEGTPRHVATCTAQWLCKACEGIQLLETPPAYTSCRLLGAHQLPMSHLHLPSTPRICTPELHCKSLLTPCPPPGIPRSPRCSL